MKHGQIGAAILIVLVIVSLVYIGQHYTGLLVKTPAKTPASSGSSSGSGSGHSTNSAYSNFEQILASNQMIKDLPSNALILLKFYNFNTGQRQWENSYVLTKGSAKLGTTAKPDITIIIASKYLAQVTSSNLCSVIKSAQSNGDFGTESGMSTLGLLWKYRSMMKYRACLGF
jgi:hypothetical protein